MSTSFLLVAALLLTSAAGHTVLTNILVNGVVQTSCVRPRANSKFDYPISDITNPNGLQSQYMTCGWPGKTANSPSKCSVPAGSTVGLEWHFDGIRGETFIVDPSHKGPCLAYMARSDTGAGAVWFKIYESGYANGKFCVDNLRANGGVFEVKIPTDLAPGNYLLRAELIALHEGFELGGAQPYVNCVELTVTGSGSSIPSTNLVAFPGAYKANDPGLFFDIYDGIRSYPIPGPPVYVAGAVTPTPTTPTPTPTPTPVPTPVPTPTTPTTPASTTTTGKASSGTTTTGKSTTTTGMSTTTTGKGTTTTGKATTTTGKASTSTGRTTTTSGRISSSTTTTGQATPPAPVPTPASSTGAKTGACPTDGYMTCASDASYQTCNHGAWTDPRPCQAGTRCSPSGNYIYCI